jgi:hypothetical protein
MFLKTRFQNAEKALTLSDVRASSGIALARALDNLETSLPDFLFQVKSKTRKRYRTLPAFFLGGNDD